MSQLTISAYLPVIEAYATRTSGGNVMDYEDAMQTGCQLVLKALRAYDAKKGDLAQYITMRLSEVLEIGRSAVKEPTSFTDILPESQDSDYTDDQIAYFEAAQGEIEGLDAVEAVPAEDAEYAQYGEVLGLASLSVDSPLALLFASFNLGLQDEAKVVLNAGLRAIRDQFSAIRALPKDNALRLMFVALGLMHDYPELEVEPQFIYEMPAMKREAGEAFAIYDEEPDTLADDRPMRVASWMGQDGEGPDSDTEISFPANGWYAPIFSVAEVGKRGQAVQHELLVEMTTRTLVNLGKSEPQEPEEIDDPLADTWAMPTEWGSRNALQAFFDGLDAPSKFSRAGRQAFCLAFIRGLGLDAAKSAAWSAHRHTIVTATPKGLVKGNGTLVPWYKAAQNPWALAFDISKAAVCDKVLLGFSHTPDAVRFATKLEHSR